MVKMVPIQCVSELLYNYNRNNLDEKINSAIKNESVNVEIDEYKEAVREYILMEYEFIASPLINSSPIDDAGYTALKSVVDEAEETHKNVRDISHMITTLRNNISHLKEVVGFDIITV